jgi:hypothetical protein
VLDPVSGARLTGRSRMFENPVRRPRARNRLSPSVSTTSALRHHLLSSDLVRPRRVGQRKVDAMPRGLGHATRVGTQLREKRAVRGDRRAHAGAPFEWPVGISRGHFSRSAFAHALSPPARTPLDRPKADALDELARKIRVACRPCRRGAPRRCGRRRRPRQVARAIHAIPPGASSFRSPGRIRRREDQHLALRGGRVRVHGGKAHQRQSWPRTDDVRPGALQRPRRSRLSGTRGRSRPGSHRSGEQAGVIAIPGDSGAPVNARVRGWSALTAVGGRSAVGPRGAARREVGERDIRPGTQTF